MSHKRNFFSTSVIRTLLAFLLLPLLLNGFQQLVSAEDDSKEKSAQITLDEILKKTGKYCKRLLDSSLYFVCAEEIKERIDYSRDALPRDQEKRLLQPIAGPNFGTKSVISGVKTNKFVYDYQLIRKNNIIEETRTLLEENGQKKNEKNTPLKTEIFDHKFVVAGPVGLLSEYWQKRHDYRIIKEDESNGKKTLVVEALPKTPFEVRHLSGKIWIKKDDFSILRIEWNQKSVENFEKIEKLARNLNSTPRITQVSEYGIEKNGIRFPSRYSVREEYINRRGKSFLRSETIVIYKDYKFFTVETGVNF